MEVPDISTSVIDSAVWPGRPTDDSGQLVLGTSGGFALSTDTGALIAPNTEVSP